TTLPSARLDAATWGAAHLELVAFLRDLIRIPSINPPDPPGPEMDAAHFIAGILRAEGLDPEVIESAPGRGNVTVRLRGDGTGGDALLLLSHLDVVPANAADGWTHDPFAADVDDGYVWGRGAVDMKQMVALETQVIVLLARRARAAGLDPARDPIPGLRRDVLYTCTADEEAGGREGAGWLAEHRPDTLRAAGALNEAGGVSVELGGRRFYPIQVAEKGFEVFRIHVHGTWGHGSMPREDNAAVMAAEAVRRLAAPGEPRLTPVMRQFLDGIRAELPPEAAEFVAAIADETDPRRSEAAIRAACDPMYARAIRALLRDSISPDIIRAGVKYNVIPGEAMIEIDCRTLPGTTPDDMREEVLARLGDLAPLCTLEHVIGRPPVEAPASGELYDLLAATIRAHDPDGIPVPVMAPFATDAKSTSVLLGVPTYGFSPLRLEPDERFLERFHGVDERVGLDALRWGLPVLYDVVLGYCR
ncbi:MAG: family metallo-hydrolase, partial [Chloroflexota bacterium]|nr:family metallo-hydrolase [Chloroflexota bacterium]